MRTFSKQIVGYRALPCKGKRDTDVTLFVISETSDDISQRVATLCRNQCVQSVNVLGGVGMSANKSTVRMHRLGEDRRRIKVLTHVLLGGLRLFIVLVRPRIDDQMVGVVLSRPMIR